MDADKLQVLIELDFGDYHAFQCVRHEHNKARHARMAQSFDELVAGDAIERVGDEYRVTTHGLDLIETAVSAARKIHADWNCTE